MQKMQYQHIHLVASYEKIQLFGNSGQKHIGRQPDLPKEMQE